MENDETVIIDNKNPEVLAQDVKVFNNLNSSNLKLLKNTILSTLKNNENKCDFKTVLNNIHNSYQANTLTTTSFVCLLHLCNENSIFYRY